MGIDVIDGIQNLFKDTNVGDIKSKWLQPRKEELPEIPAEVSVNVPRQTSQPVVQEGETEQDAIDEVFQLPVREPFPEPDFSFPEELEVDLRGDDEVLQEEVNTKAELLSVKQRFEEGSLVTRQEKGQARADHFKEVLQMENAQNKGLVKTSTGSKWMPIESGEGRGPDKSMSIYEIGHGIKIPESWMSDNKAHWPEVDGVKVNIKEGLTRDQEESMMRKLLDKSYEDAKKNIRNWDDLTENEKVFWGDFAYNAGGAALNKNPKAKAALKRGDTAEAMVHALDYIGSGGKPSRGLLKRRITMYNKAASEMNGVPLIEAYEFGKKIRVKFAHGFMTDKVSKKLADSVAESPWRTFSSWTGKHTGRDYAETLGDDMKFKG